MFFGILVNVEAYMDVVFWQYIGIDHRERKESNYKMLLKVDFLSFKQLKTIQVFIEFVDDVNDDDEVLHAQTLSPCNNSSLLLLCFIAD